MPGMWKQSGNQVFGLDGRPEVGARCYFFQASSSTPLTTYTDYSLAVENPAFVETDSYGRWPPVFFDDSTSLFYRERATDPGGSIVYFDTDVVPIIGPGEGGDVPDVPVDPDALLKTGDLKVRYDTGVKAGFVRANGRTIGSAVSGASERANADTQDLFEHLWGVDEDLEVSGGRGVSATADFEANKTIALPDIRGRALVGLDTMGNSAAGRVSGLDALGKAVGSQSTTLTAGQIPQITGTTGSSGAHDHHVFRNSSDDGTLTGNNYPQSARAGGVDSLNYWIMGTNDGEPTLGLTSEEGAHTHTVTAGDPTPDTLSLVQPSMGVTVYIKL